jgi:hypothetical protein
MSATAVRLERYRPRLVVVEFNATIPNDIDWVQEADPDVHQGSSLAAFVRLGREMGYELVATSDFNAFFVDARLVSSSCTTARCAGMAAPPCCGRTSS